MKNQKLSLDNLRQAAYNAGQKLDRWSVGLFLGLVVILYGFVLFRINTLSNARPSDAQLSSQSAPVTPHIDPAIINQVQQLQDNSVSVQALFDQARSNPFQ